MDNINKISAERVGSVIVSMYKDKSNGHHLFYIKSENEDVLQLSYIIEDVLYHY